jgi:hypothetical protein
MAQSILIFDFGTNEEAAQQARHKLEGWKQAFRLGNKVLLKFERQAPATEEGQREEKQASGEAQAGKKKAPAPRAKEGGKNQTESSPSRIRLLVRLAFSDHEKMSHQRWLSRIPAEDAFKSAQAETVHSGGPAFRQASELFDSLD